MFYTWSFFHTEVFLFKTFVSLKLKIFIGTSFTFWGSFIAVETFNQQLILALIAAAPPTAAVIVTCIVLMKGQQKMATAMDGKLSQLLVAEKGVAKAEGKEEERVEARERLHTDPPQKVEVVTDRAPVEVKITTSPKNKTL